MSPHVMDRYRELGSTLEASRTVLQEQGCHMWHRIGERCPCGHLSIPSPFYNYNPETKKERSHKEAEKAYLEWLGSDKRPEWVNPPVMRELSPPDVPSGDKLRGVPIDNMSGLPDVCPKCLKRPNETGRSSCSACRKSAYRERKSPV